MRVTGDVCANRTARGPATTVIQAPTPPPGPNPNPLLPTPPSRPVPEQQADQQLKRVLERKGAPNAKCTKKQYGGGWVTVCE
jgi:hypothetical protein